MKRVLNLLFYRTSSQPAKQFIYLLLQRDRNLSKGKRIGVDFGCKSMRNYPVFRTEKYYGVDLDKEALEKGLATYPAAYAVHSRIEDAEVPSADFAICIEVFNANNLYDADWEDLLNKIIAKIKNGGILLITVRTVKEVQNLQQILKGKFRHVERWRCDLDNSESKLSVLVALYYFIFKKRQAKSRIDYFRCIDRV